MKSKILVILSVAALFSACSPSRNEVNESSTPEETEKVEKYSESIEIHDEVMPLIDSIFNSRSILMDELQRAADGVKSVNEERKKALKEIVEELETADEVMFEWMDKYGAMPPDSLSHEEIMEHLNEGYDKIQEVKAIMLKSLEDARNAIERDSIRN